MKFPQPVEQCKDIANYLMTTYLVDKKESYKETLNFRGYILHFEYNYSKHPERFILVEKSVPGMFIPGVISQGTTHLMSFRKQLKEDGILYLGEGDWNEVVNTLSDVLVSRTTIVDPLMEVINHCGKTCQDMLWIDDFGYDDDDINLCSYLEREVLSEPFHMQLNTTEDHQPVVVCINPTSTDGIFVQAQVFGDLKKLSNDVREMCKRFFDGEKAIDNDVAEILKLLRPDLNDGDCYYIDFYWHDYPVNAKFNKDGSEELIIKDWLNKSDIFILGGVNKDGVTYPTMSTHTRLSMSSLIEELLKEIKLNRLDNCKVIKTNPNPE